MLRAIAHTLRLRGARTIIVGIQPEVAFAMVQRGPTREEITTTGNLEEDLASPNQRVAGGRHVK
jgi:rsbT antagonist protein RsbS